MSWLTSLYIFSLIWSLGALLDGKSRQTFDEFFRQLVTGHDKENPKPKNLKITKVCLYYKNLYDRKLTIQHIPIGQNR